MMRGIAETGGGDYFFIANAEDITKYMSRAIHGLLDLIGFFSFSFGCGLSVIECQLYVVVLSYVKHDLTLRDWI